ncbi:hypothetical protein V6N13_058945 [Hibiscus sabdariffa]
MQSDMKVASGICRSKSLVYFGVWPGILGNTLLDTTGFQLQSSGSRSIQAPPSWSGRFWGSTGCIQDPNTGQITCQTGDCGSTRMACNGKGASPPVTLAEFTVGSGTYDQGGERLKELCLEVKLGSFTLMLLHESWRHVL